MPLNGINIPARTIAGLQNQGNFTIIYPKSVLVSAPMKRMFALLLLIFPLILFANPAEQDKVLFTNIFKNWTDAFNHKDLKSCNLFSKHLIANYQGAPTKNYMTICNGFKKIFNEKDKRYHYTFKLHQIYRKDNLATVRVTWYLTIYEKNKIVSKTQDEGLDIFEKDQKSTWKIIQYLAYPVLH